jgi:hypothetical protein
MSVLIVSNSVNPVKALNFFAVVGKLKLLKRTGWVNNNVFEPESVADHMYRMSMLTFMLLDTDIKRDHLMKVCMIHDLAEALVGTYMRINEYNYSHIDLCIFECIPVYIYICMCMNAYL